MWLIQWAYFLTSVIVNFREIHLKQGESWLADQSEPWIENVAYKRQKNACKHCMLYFELIVGIFISNLKY